MNEVVMIRCVAVVCRLGFVCVLFFYVKSTWMDWRV